jgi:hypothetical protein
MIIMRRLLLLGVTAALLAGCGPKKIPVVAARGKLLLLKDGQRVPMAGARIVLSPVTGQTSLPALPAATVGADGSFELGTYGRNDGAPEGEYIVAIEWKVMAKPKYDVLGKGKVAQGPDQLDGRYANPATSPLRATVAAGQDLTILVPSP